MGEDLGCGGVGLRKSRIWLWLNKDETRVLGALAGAVICNAQ